MTNVVEEFGINKSIVSRAKPHKEFRTTETNVRKVGGGRPKKLTAVNDRYIVLQVKKAQNQSASKIA